ncbi:MAG: polyphosphate kinase 1 [Gammaproteobacteria bacterium]|nr:polyphosphate kinase 1 [Gammaproteobacteria bacterium]NNF62590.1 polyphosphate kinase 1 [Gammaproteobacteria bacterium]NNM19848.1 polyphosphate kinase 1 [Gammaproteobacteria bacterium]
MDMRNISLDSPDLYLNRELSWLGFNERVLQEAADERTPLLERVKFLAIVSGNLDEFFMKRIGGLKRLIASGHSELSVDGRTPAEQIAECHAMVREIQLRREAILTQVKKALDEHDIGVMRWTELGGDERKRLRNQFVRDIFPLVTPLAMDPSHPFPFISNLALNLLVTMRFPGDDEIRMARVKVPVVPSVVPRLFHVGEGNRFVTLEDIMSNNLDLLFPGMKIESCELFRVTRNAIVETDQSDADDLLEQVKTELEERDFTPIVRLQVESGMDPVHRGMLTAELGLEDEDVFEVDHMIAMNDLFEVAALDMPELHYTPHHPVDHPRLAQDPRNIFHIIRDGGPLLLQHPYHAFNTSVERFLRTASEDPKVLAIKMTLYRTSAEGNVIQSLINAARNDKEVAVLVELKARFDEEANIGWARRLEEAGIHVTYGVIGLKTHTKMILVVRKDYDGLRRYTHIGTGNYHPGTARLYGDLGMLSCDDALGADLTELFNYITGYSPPRSYRKILAAPYTLKKGLLAKIEREIKKHTPEKPGLIQLKTNALEDAEITEALYQAGQAGVRVDLLVRDTCRLRPGIPGLSDNIRVVSTVGRFLEHARIYYFHNGGKEEYFIGSADLMKRNLDSRVEVVAPVESSELREELRLMLNVQLADRRSAWEMDGNGVYSQRQPTSEKDSEGAQDALIAVAEKRYAAVATREQKKVRKKLIKQFDKRLKSESD